MRTRVLQKLLLREQQAPELEEHAGIGHVMIERKGLLLSNDETSADSRIGLSPFLVI